MIEWKKETDSERADVHPDYPIILEVMQVGSEEQYRGIVHIADAKIKSDKLMPLEQAKAWAAKRCELFLEEMKRSLKGV